LKKITTLVLVLLFSLVFALPIQAENYDTTRIDADKQVVLYRYTNKNADFSANVSTDPHSAMGHVYVLIAYKNRLIDGYPGGWFGPQQSITRAETAAMIYKAIGTEHMTKVVMADRQD